VCTYPPGGESPENLQQGGRRHDRAINTTDVMSDTAASYAISNEQRGKEKRSGQPAGNGSKQAGMGKKSLVVLLIGLALASVHPAEAQQPAKVPRIGVISQGSLSSTARNIKAFREGLRDLGYVEGQNITIEYRYAEGVDERFPNLADELVQLKINVIVANSTPATQAAKNATRTIPIVMINVSDPVGTGLVASLAHPGGNVTGLSNLNSDLGGKQLELLKEAFPKVSRVAILWDPGNAGNATWLEDMKVTAGPLRITLQPLEVHGPDDLERALLAIKKEHADALSVLANAVTNTNRARIADFAAKSRLPAMYPNNLSVETGGLMSYGPNPADLYRRAATYVDKILKGAKPADLPVEQPTKFELIINLKAAKQIDLTIPPNVLVRADRVIK
jgi:putative ABC transport system substrate-binding protein